jgi:hypothetical protein
MPATPRPFAFDRPLLLALYVLEGALALLLLGLHRLGERALLGSLATRPAQLAIAGAATALAAAALAAQRMRRAPAGAGAPALLVNLVGLGLALGTGELAVRVLATRGLDGPALLGTPLVPRSFEAVRRRHAAILERARTQGSFYVADPELGWTVGPSRESENGLYRSSAEGLRVAEVGIHERGGSARPRVALVGDSYTFCEEIAFEDCWSRHLSLALGPGVQVLNFGVPGYGVDQIRLRYERDVRPWQPALVLFGVFPHDLDRTLTIYNFVSFPSWGFPFAKPRFTVEDGVLRNRLPRPPAPEEILAHRSIDELPLLDLDAGFVPFEWRWRPLYASWLVRAVASRLPPPRDPPAAVSDAARDAVNGALLEAFLASARAAGSEAVLVYFPARMEHPDDPDYRPELAGTRAWLEGRGLPFFDLTPAVRSVPVPERYLAIGRHFTPETNRRVAAALRELVRERLARRAP